jgi:hypothetical protein
VQNCGINPDFDLFLQRKNGGPSPRAVDRARVAGPRGPVDLTVAGGQSSPELSLPFATVSEKSPRMENLGEGNNVKLTRGFSGRCGNGGRLAARKQIGGDFFLWTRSLEPRKMMRNAAKVCGEGRGDVRCLL